MRLLLCFLITLFPLSVLPQGTGHPGGGRGPDDPYKTAEFCKEVEDRLISYETDFCEHWSVKYKDVKDFMSLISHIQMLEMMDLIHHSLKDRDHELCKQISHDDSNFRLWKRKTAEKELNLLKKYIELSNPIIKKTCPWVYTIRSQSLDNIRELIKMYEK